MKRALLLLVFLVSYFTLDAQNNIKISMPEVSFLNNILTIKYDIAGCGTGDYVNIKLIVLNSQGDTIKPVYVSGDIGSSVNCAFGKKIEWNVAKDGIVINEELEIQVTGSPVAKVIPVYNPGLKSVSRGKILLSSAFVPGLGQKKASGKSGYLIFSGLVYGSAGASLYYFLKSDQYYEKYDLALGTERDALYEKAVNSFNASQYMLYTAAGLWAVNMIWSAAIPIKDLSKNKLDVSLLPMRDRGYLFSARWTF
jgi:hypothetical protein